jgi:site-specific DNA-methyltransferase (adenine-specific)
MAEFNLMQGNSLELLKTLEDNSIDAIVTDPPYGLSQHSQGDIVNALTAWLAGEEYTHGKGGFMGKAWDSFVPSPMLFKECYRVLKHGGHILCFAGSRTQDLMSLSIRLAGFEMRDACLWLYGSGFPKGCNIAKGIDKYFGKEPKIVGEREDFANGKAKNNFEQFTTINPSDKGINSKAFQEKMGAIYEFQSNEAKQWEGWNTNLKPAYEPIIMARKPLDGTVVNNVLKHGVGGLNIDACRVKTDDATDTQGRYPANIILDGSDSVEALFPYTKCGDNKIGHKNGGTFGTDKSILYNQKGSEGSASRYFYHAKASKKDRDEGLEGFGLQEAQATAWSGEGMPLRQDGTERKMPLARNTHSTVKPTQLMRYLVKLVTPQGGLVLDPFMGSGSTGKACMLEGFNFIGMELSEEYVKIAEARIEHAQQQRGLLNE